MREEILPLSMIAQILRDFPGRSVSVFQNAGSEYEMDRNSHVCNEHANRREGKARSHRHVVLAERARDVPDVSWIQSTQCADRDSMVVWWILLSQSEAVAADGSYIIGLR